MSVNTSKVHAEDKDSVGAGKGARESGVAQPRQLPLQDPERLLNASELAGGKD